VSRASKHRVTLRDVAREAGVSLSAVSYVLNNSLQAQRISEQTGARIREAANRLGYQCDPIGRALQRGYTNQVTLLIVTWNLAISHAATAMAISRAAARHDLALTVHVADDDETAEAFVRRKVLHGLGGVLVLWDSPAFRKSALREVAKEGLPVIDLLPDSPDGVSMVTVDREDAFFRGTQYLIELGHREIGLIGDVVRRPKTTLRKLAGYRRALAKAGLRYKEAWVQNVTEFGFEGGQHGFADLVRRCPTITALFCINDAIALGAIDTAKKLGRNCPSDLSVVGFGDSPEGRHWHPALTTFALSSDLVAASAIRLISEQRVQRRMEQKTILIPEDLIVRESSGPAQTRHTIREPGT
jgi:DNA-binding LacI/PurR family transcriptional regulator